MNRVDRHSDCETGKPCVSHDKFVEHGNSCFFAFLVTRSLKGFIGQSLYAEYGLLCQAFTDNWYTANYNRKKIVNYQRTSALTQTK